MENNLDFLSSSAFRQPLERSFQESHKTHLLATNDWAEAMFPHLNSSLLLQSLQSNNKPPDASNLIYFFFLFLSHLEGVETYAPQLVCVDVVMVCGGANATKTLVII